MQRKIIFILLFFFNSVFISIYADKKFIEIVKLIKEKKIQTRVPWPPTQLPEAGTGTNPTYYTEITGGFIVDSSAIIGTNSVDTLTINSTTTFNGGIYGNIQINSPTGSTPGSNSISMGNGTNGGLISLNTTGNTNSISISTTPAALTNNAAGNGGAITFSTSGSANTAGTTNNAGSITVDAQGTSTTASGGSGGVYTVNMNGANGAALIGAAGGAGGSYIVNMSGGSTAASLATGPGGAGGSIAYTTSGGNGLGTVTGSSGGNGGSVTFTTSGGSCASVLASSGTSGNFTVNAIGISGGAKSGNGGNIIFNTYGGTTGTAGTSGYISLNTSSPTSFPASGSGVILLDTTSTSFAFTGVVPKQYILLSSSTVVGGTTFLQNPTPDGSIILSSGTTTTTGNYFFYPLPAAVAGSAINLSVTGRLQRTPSSLKFKENIERLSNSVTKDILDLDLYKYNYKGSDANNPQYGVIGEYIIDQGIFPHTIFYELDGKTVAGVDYQTLYISALYQLQKLKKEFDQLAQILKNKFLLTSIEYALIQGIE